MFKNKDEEKYTLCRLICGQHAVRLTGVQCDSIVVVEENEEASGGVCITGSSSR